MAHQVRAAGLACLFLANPAAAECIHSCPSYGFAAFFFAGLAVALVTGLIGAVRLFRGKDLTPGLIALFLGSAVPVGFVTLNEALDWF